MGPSLEYLPADLRKVVGDDTRVDAQVRLDRTVEGAFGEARLLRCGGRWRLFSRGSILQPWQEYAMATGQAFRYSETGFQRRLRVVLEAGEAVELSVGILDADLARSLDGHPAGTGHEASEEPATPVPAIQAPALQVPAIQAPALQVPAIQAPALQVPATQVPPTQVPAIQSPRTDLPPIDGAFAERRGSLLDVLQRRVEAGGASSDLRGSPQVMTLRSQRQSLVDLLNRQMFVRKATLLARARSRPAEASVRRAERSEATQPDPRLSDEPRRRKEPRQRRGKRAENGRVPEQRPNEPRGGPSQHPPLFTRKHWFVMLVVAPAIFLAFVAYSSCRSRSTPARSDRVGAEAP